MPLPPLPERIDPDGLRDLDDGGLAAAAAAVDAARRATETAMAPFSRQLRELGARTAEIATEQRRRERAQRHAARVRVREQAQSGELPSLADVLAATEAPVAAELPLRELRAFLRTGGEVAFGFATKPGFIGFTDGRQVRQARTSGEARDLYAAGWEPGAPGNPGVRVHLVGTRIERLAPPEDVVVEVGASGAS